MRRLILAAILLLILSTSHLVLVSFQKGTQTEYSIDVIGYTWNHSTINVSILPQENEVWWERSYLNASLHGIVQWNDAIQEFASNHADFSYLSSLNLVPTVSNEVVSDFDIYVRWKAECQSEAMIGQSQATVQSPCIVENIQISLAAKAPSGHVMTEVDMQNMIVHEIGHTFGLSHSKSSSDVMYAIVNYRETVKSVSSLDIYALGQIFKWMTNSTQFSFPNICPEESELTMPSSISYVHFQIAAENLPVASPQNLFEYTLRLFLRPESLTLIIVIVTLIIATVLIIKRRKKPQ